MCFTNNDFINPTRTVPILRQKINSQFQLELDQLGIQDGDLVMMERCEIYPFDLPDFPGCKFVIKNSVTDDNYRLDYLEGRGSLKSLLATKYNSTDAVLDDDSDR